MASEGSPARYRAAHHLTRSTSVHGPTPAWGRVTGWGRAAGWGKPQGARGGGRLRSVLAHRVIDDAGRFLAEVDLAYPDRRIAIELDGFRWHSSPARKHAEDAST